VKLKWLLITLTLIIILGSAGSLAYRQSQATDSGESVSGSAAQAFAAGTIAIETGIETVASEGELVPVRHVALAFQSGGTVAELLVAEGDQVEAGQPLIRLEPAELQATLAQAEAALAQAEAGEAAAVAQVAAAQTGVRVAEIGVTAAKAQLAWIQAEPSPEEMAVFEAGIAAATAGINQAAGQRDVNLAGATPAQLAAAQAQVAAASAEKRIIQDQYDRLIENEVFGTLEEQLRFALNAAEASLAAANVAVTQLQQGPTAAQRTAAQSAVAVASAQRDVAQAQLDLLLASAREEQVAIAEVAVAQAEIAVEQAQVAVGQAEAAARQAEAAVRQAAASRDAALAMLSKMNLRAPFAGKVARLSVEPGQVVNAGSPVVTIADLSGWLVETTDLTELKVVAVEVGLPVSVRVDALPEVVLRGHVTDIAAVSTLVRGDVTYKVTIRLDDRPDLPLRWGMTAFVNVQVAQ
jgi:multidrug resistance efflux pump